MPAVEPLSRARHTAQPAVDDGNSGGAQLFTEHEVLIVADAVFHLIIGRRLSSGVIIPPQIGIGRARCLFAVGGDLRDLPVLVQGISEHRNSVLAVRTGYRADGIFPVIIAGIVQSLDDTAAGEAEELGRKRRDRLVEIVFDARSGICILCLERDVVKIDGAAALKRDKKIYAGVRRSICCERCTVFDPICSARIDLARSVNRTAVPDLKRDLTGIALDKRGKEVIHPFFHRHRNGGMSAVAESSSAALRNDKITVIHIAKLGIARKYARRILHRNGRVAPRRPTICRAAVSRTCIGRTAVLKRTVDEQIVVQRKRGVVNVFQKEAEQIGRNAVCLRSLVNCAGKRERCRRIGKCRRLGVRRFRHKGLLFFRRRTGAKQHGRSDKRRNQQCG